MWIEAENDKKEAKKSAAKDLDHIIHSYCDPSPQFTVMINQ